MEVINQKKGKTKTLIQAVEGRVPGKPEERGALRRGLN